MKTLFSLLLSIPFLLFGESKAVQDGDQWLAIVDQGNYQESWQKGSLTLRLKIPESAFVAILEATRKPLGTVVKRELVKETEAKDPENLPKGDYRILLFQTDFKNQKQAKELLMLIQESDGTWRTLSYLVTSKSAN